MHGRRIDRFVPALGDEAHRRRVTAALLGAALAGPRSMPLAAQEGTPALGGGIGAGSGGYATASANGGVVAIAAINSGGNAANAIGVGDSYGAVWVDGGDVSNSTTVGVSADGGTAIADASGGSYNIAFVS